MKELKVTIKYSSKYIVDIERLKRAMELMGLDRKDFTIKEFNRNTKIGVEDKRARNKAIKKIMEYVYACYNEKHPAQSAVIEVCIEDYLKVRRHMNRERIAKIILKTLYDADQYVDGGYGLENVVIDGHFNLLDIADRIIAEEGKPQQPKLPEQLPIPDAIKDGPADVVTRLYCKVIEIIDYLKAREV